VRTRRLVAALAAFLFSLNVADYLLTIWALSLGGIELNPIMSPIISTPFGPIVKIALVGILCVFVALRLRFKPGVAVLAAVTTIYVAVVAWNSLNLALYYI
jgi:hypothetical protein